MPSKEPERIDTTFEAKSVIDASTKEAAEEMRMRMKLKGCYRLGEETSSYPLGAISQETHPDVQRLKLVILNPMKQSQYFLNAAEFEYMKQVLTREAAEKAQMRWLLNQGLVSGQIAEDLRSALRFGRNEKRHSKVQHKEARALVKKKKRESRQYAQPLLPPNRRELPSFYNLPEVSNESCQNLYQISTKVCIAGKWYHAKVDQTRNSALDLRLISQYSTQDHKRPPKHANSWLFLSQEWMKYHAQSSSSLPLTFQTIFQPWELDKDLYCPTRCAIGEVEIQLKISGQTQGTIRLRDGTRVKVDITFPDSPAGNDLFKDLSESPLRDWYN
ncbi:hypothetical protein P171DRAFT_481076 [Karstenula rhodostoma CBS 690.94]|uniref:Uncharacterized protein n=1 Tax=Karstenula rhodostoma CBS 690.94 TaxID=1392251 RepID=A0A9P4PTR5_9PLEO|nr:hypothetical protein P171DRAFT_481076 [Karstenula rhodostoma CBS 690.94]